MWFCIVWKKISPKGKQGQLLESTCVWAHYTRKMGRMQNSGLILMFSYSATEMRFGQKSVKMCLSTLLLPRPITSWRACCVTCPDIMIMFPIKVRRRRFTSLFLQRRIVSRRNSVVPYWQCCIFLSSCSTFSLRMVWWRLSQISPMCWRRVSLKEMFLIIPSTAW